jgi:hypothetical protein
MQRIIRKESLGIDVTNDSMLLLLYDQFILLPTREDHDSKGGIVIADRFSS